MRLENASGEFFQLKILDYEFPELIDDEYDSNWLMIGVEANHIKKGVWTAADPSLLTFEVEKLISWLRELRDDYTQAQSTLDFWEPNLTFKLLIEKNNPIIRVVFDYETRPDWSRKKYREGPLEDLWCDFPIVENDLNEAISSLRTQLEKYPERARQP
jgi:hypothetical protein